MLFFKGIFVVCSIWISLALRCGINNIQKKPAIIKTTSLFSRLRYLQSSFAPIRITIEETLIQAQNLKDSAYTTKVISSLKQTVELLGKVVKVKSLKNLKLTEKSLSACNLSPSQVDQNLIASGYSDSDLVIFPKLNAEMGSVQAAAYFCVLDESSDYRPIAGVIEINSNYDFNKMNSEKYLKMLFFHELTHVLVFDTDLFAYFPKSIGDVTMKKTVNGVERTLIKTPKVVQMAKKYYGCDSVEGIELEDQGGYGTAGSHWESRIMLGDYMVGADYSEITISEITLALFEDSGWYQINYYTGGLFRYGKGKGCDFLNTKCIQNDKVMYNNEFCNEQSEQRCFSSRTGRGICYLSSRYQKGRIPAEYQYYSDPRKGGYIYTDYCPVTYYTTETVQGYYTSSCNSGEYEMNLGEVGENSVCMISSLGEGEKESENALCFKIDCGVDSFRVSVGNQVVDCPRAGGIVNVTNYEGVLYCPDYNLVCTSDVFCNEPIDCISKEAEYKEDTFTYNYQPKSSQLESLGCFIALEILPLLLLLFVL